MFRLILSKPLRISLKLNPLSSICPQVAQRKCKISRNFKYGKPFKPKKRAGYTSSFFINNALDYLSGFNQDRSG